MVYCQLDKLINIIWCLLSASRICQALPSHTDLLLFYSPTADTSPSYNKIKHPLSETYIYILTNHVPIRLLNSVTKGSTRLVKIPLEELGLEMIILHF